MPEITEVIFRNAVSYTQKPIYWFRLSETETHGYSNLWKIKASSKQQQKGDLEMWVRMMMQSYA